MWKLIWWSRGEDPRKYYHLTEEGREYQKKLRAEWFEFVGAVARVLGQEQ